jgi:hypothetical protein
MILDYNALRYPSSPLTPIILAIQQMDPNFEFGSYDVVTDRNNIRKLLSFFGEGARGEDEFRIDVQLVDGRILLFTRWESQEQREHVFSYSQEFMKTSTILPDGLSAMHHRISTLVSESL